jgi:hypothetical protein
MEETKSENIHRRLLEYLLEHCPATLPPGAAEDTPPSVNIQLTLKGGTTFIGNVRRGPLPGLYVAVCSQQDKQGRLTMAELYFAGDDLALIVRPLDDGTPRVSLASPSDLPAGVRIR